jgi:low temperature requirement protein LtrA
VFASPIDGWPLMNTDEMALHIPMVGRDATDDTRVATPLELFFDLTFVVAVAQAGTALHHALAQGRVAHAIGAFPMIFFAIWWAWMNFTWFASAYDTDDVLYRLMVFIQMIGVLILAAGIPRAFEHNNFAIMTVGYVVMRLAMVSLWLRAAIGDSARRRCAMRYAIGISVVQVGWIARLALNATAGTVAFIVLVIAELAVPVWAEAAGRTTWHPRHMAERYGLFTIIVLGESILAATNGVQAAIDNDQRLSDLAPVIVGGLLIVFTMWWIYFAMPRERAAEALRVTFDARSGGAFGWGYGHYLVLGAAAATGAGLSVAIDHATGAAQLTDRQTGATTTVPVAIYLVAVWLIHRRYKRSRLHQYTTPAAVLLILGSTFTAEPVLFAGILIAALLAVGLVSESAGY